eukprot:6196979-Pleurochrysis_carterae.AAC.5
MIRKKAGTRNPSVFPDPVFAIPTTSRPRMAGAHEAAWMGDGEGKPARRISAMIEGGSCASSNVMNGGGVPGDSVTSFFANQPCTSTFHRDWRPLLVTPCCALTVVAAPIPFEDPRPATDAPPYSVGGAATAGLAGRSHDVSFVCVFQ